MSFSFIQFRDYEDYDVIADGRRVGRIHYDPFIRLWIVFFDSDIDDTARTFGDACAIARDIACEIKSKLGELKEL